MYLLTLAGDDVMYGGAGSGIFVLGAGDGADIIFAGAGSHWIDQLELDGQPSVGSLGVYGKDWTVSLDHGSIVSQDTGSLQLCNDADGEINFSDRSTLNLFDLELINWSRETVPRFVQPYDYQFERREIFRRSCNRVAARSMA